MDTPQIPNDPLSRFSLSIFWINGLLMQNGDKVTRPIGQSSARWQVLGRAGYVPQTVAQMAREMGHTRQSVQRIADVLAIEGLVAYKDNPADRRARLIDLTPQGVVVLDAIYSRNEALSHYIIAKLDPNLLTEAAHLLENIAQILERNIPSEHMLDEKKED